MTIHSRLVAELQAQKPDLGMNPHRHEVWQQAFDAVQEVMLEPFKTEADLHTEIFELTAGWATTGVNMSGPEVTVMLARLITATAELLVSEIEEGGAEEDKIVLFLANHITKTGRILAAEAGER